jgi:hypothetical protein
MAPGPDPADVAAERSRWTAVRDVAADGLIEQVEAELLGPLLVEWDAKLQAEEAAANAARDPQRIMQDLIRVYGMSVVAGAFGPDLKKAAPDVFRLFDLDGSGVLDPAELMSIDLTSPSSQIVLATTLANITVQLIQKQRDR